MFFFRGTCLCIPHSSFGDFLVWELHVGNLTGHFGKEKTTVLFANIFYWPILWRDVTCIVPYCTTCLYTSFHITRYPWKDLSMNFLLSLIRINRVDNSIFVIVDRFFKIDHFILYFKTTYATQISKLFFKEIVWYYRIPFIILFDRYVKFVSYFWKTFWKLFGTTLNFSSRNQWLNWVY